MLILSEKATLNESIIVYLRKLIWVTLVIFLVSCDSQEGEQEFKLLNVDKASEDKIQLRDYRGSWILVNFWADWCKLCKDEVEELNQLHSQAGLLNLHILAISYDPVENKKLLEVIDNWGINYPVMATSPVPILPFSLPESLPAHYLINPDGMITKKLLGKQSFKTLTSILKDEKNIYKTGG
jgi:peroxiredoxin